MLDPPEIHDILMIRYERNDIFKDPDNTTLILNLLDIHILPTRKSWRSINFPSFLDELIKKTTRKSGNIQWSKG